MKFKTLTEDQKLLEEYWSNPEALTQKMIVVFEEGAEPETVMQDVLARCKKVEDDCEIYL